MGLSLIDFFDAKGLIARSLCSVLAGSPHADDITWEAAPVVAHKAILLCGQHALYSLIRPLD